MTLLVGACSRSELDGASGIAQPCVTPVVIASATGNVWELAVDSTFAYWSGVPNTLNRTRLDDFTTEPVFDGLNGTSAIAIDDRFVYFGCASNAYPKTFVRWSRTTASSNPWIDFCPGSVASNDGSLFGVEGVFDSSRNLVQVDKVTAVKTVRDKLVGPGLAIDSSSVYYENAAQNEVLRAPLEGGPASHLASIAVSAHQFERLATSSTSLYATMTGESQTSIVRIAPDGTITDVVSNITSSYVLCFGVSDDVIYYGTADAIMYVPKQGGAPIKLTDSNVCHSIAFDATNVYWSSGTIAGTSWSCPCTIQRVCRP